MGNLISLKDVRKTYEGKRPHVALRSVDLTVREGDFIAVTGPSGSGKSTLLNIIGLLDRPSRGEYSINDSVVGRLNSRRIAHLRSRTFGFVFQAFSLIDQRSVSDNVEIGLLYRGTRVSERRYHARGALDLVGMISYTDADPRTLSGGERQRVAIARALVGQPKVLLCDEPTGNLDSEATAALMNLFRAINDRGTTVIIVTHDPEVSAAASRSVHVRDGEVRDA